MTLLLAFLTLMAVPTKDDPMERLKNDILQILSVTKGTFAVALEDLSTGRRLLVNEREMFHAASTMKTPVLIELYRKVQRGDLHLSDSLVIRNAFTSIVDGSPYTLDPNDDSDDSLYTLTGRKATVQNLIERMITVSSNLATNILIEVAGPSNVTASMRALGADSIQVRRGVEDQKAYDAGLNNVTNAFDLMVILKAIAEGRASDPPGCKEMIAVLERQRFHDIIPALLPAGTMVAHKTGSITGVEHDSGIVFLPDGRKYVVVLLSKNLQTNKEGKEALAKVSKRIYDFISTETR